ncbi:DUF421 domain-containing protein [Croceicoccus gelatinilyticus]|uniref:DUF421 domain-containing protein n=1 Tax=Croceicoccus gelatinilyticus TaxID=2835536 RepID=UPI001BCBE5E5|nr:YetF domain-containing protein [Croceicoccus gelatinilyticus]MBS7671636.1 DUF421 domain-containing protein [Croceicoccus gelatinilyticus]
MKPILLPETWEPLLRIAITAPVLYLLIIVFIRISGKRSTSQMNNFDWIVTVALGSIAASTIVLKELTLAEGAFAIGLLLAMQFILTALVRRYDTVSAAVKATPTMLLDEGSFIDSALRRERISQREVLAAVRKAGVTDLNEVAWVILENDASFSVISKADRGPGTSAMKEIDNFDHKARRVLD